MNYLKVQQDLLKNAITEKGEWLFGKYENSIGVSEGHVIWLIPQSCFILDTEQLKKHSIRDFDVARMLEFNYCKYEDAVASDELKQYNKKTLVNIKGGDKEAWVDVSLLKYFNSPTFKVSSPTSPLMVFEKEELVGVVCPVKLKDGEK